MEQQLTIDFNKPMPLFPLPGCVLLPHATIPLQFFEPRYIQMAGDAIAGSRLICTATFQGDEWKTHYNQSPPVEPGVCVGYIVEHRRTPDRRYHVLLQGLCRARILNELPDEDLAYRSAFFEPVDIQPHDENDFSDIRLRIDGLLHEPLLEQLAAIRAIGQWHEMAPDTPTLVDVGTMALSEDTPTRYHMLSEAHADKRAQAFEAILRRTLRTMELAQRHAPRELTDHMHLN